MSSVWIRDGCHLVNMVSFMWREIDDRLSSSHPAFSRTGSKHNASLWNGCWVFKCRSVRTFSRAVILLRWAALFRPLSAPQMFNRTRCRGLRWCLFNPISLAGLVHTLSFTSTSCSLLNTCCRVSSTDLAHEFQLSLKALHCDVKGFLHHHFPLEKSFINKDAPWIKN